ncbi:MULTISPECIES: hypothetical protein [Pseudomonas]|uniref:N-acetyltransferase domain-containing protein n=1 Tax=Pseudomonas kilonensis TaxID=132476 RepID=A0ABY0YQC4_9PSED|nr:MULTISPECIES: hypothetical protein [Pseudomonas]EPJ92247.1 hypothetical protein CFII68_08418 [Pseudomonas sp. CFII68]OOG89077.1 hypothetical protein B0E42_02660 [Pseudomonas sp. A25(2017)]SED84734.1 hypothetical protein SAMN04490188_1711 [Pseudomonas kilonensis]
MNSQENSAGWDLDYSAVGRSFPESFKAKIVADLQQGMPEYDVNQYFGNQPGIFEIYEHLALAIDSNTEKVVGIIGAKSLPFGSSSFLYLWTAMIADEYRGSALFKKLNQFFLKNVIQAIGMPKLIVAKTYNPVVYNMFRVMSSRVPSARFYPDLRVDVQSADMAALAVEIVHSLSKDLVLDVNTGVIPGGQSSVAPNFFPKMDMSSDEVTNAHFIKHVTYSDQILCVVMLQPDSEWFVKEKIIR